MVSVDWQTDSLENAASVINKMVWKKMYLKDFP